MIKLYQVGVSFEAHYKCEKQIIEQHIKCPSQHLILIAEFEILSRIKYSKGIAIARKIIFFDIGVIIDISTKFYL